MNIIKSPIRYALVIMMFAALAMSGFTNMVFSARAVDVMTTFDMTQAQLSSISGVSNLGGFFFSILFGYLADRFGIRKCPTVLFGCAAGVAVIRIFVHSYWPLWWLTFTASALFLPANMMAPKLFAPYFEPKGMASAIGFYSAGAGLGTTIAFGLANLFPTTQMALVFIAVAMIVIFVLWVVLVREPEERAKKLGIEYHGPEGVGEGEQASMAATGRALVQVLKSPTMIKVMVCGGLAVGGAMLVNSYAVTCMIGKGMAEGQASATATVMNVCLLIGGILAGFIVDKIGYYNIPYLIICAVGGVGYFLVYRFVPIGIPTMVGMGVCSFIIAGSIGVNMGRINLIPMTGEFKQELCGAAGGMNQTAAGLFGWVLPVIVASIFQTNYVGMFTCGAVLYIVLGVFGLLVPELGVKGKIAKAALSQENEQQEQG